MGCITVAERIDIFDKEWGAINAPAIICHLGWQRNARSSLER